jgi:hypothetical protein
MHTLGHTAMSHTSTSQSGLWPATMLAMASDTPPAGMTTPRTHNAAPAAGVASVWAGASRPGGVPGGMWDICLAVLGTAVALLALGRLRRRAPTARPAFSRWPLGAATATRAPPPRLALRLVDLSVVRR